MASIDEAPRIKWGNIYLTKGQMAHILDAPFRADLPLGKKNRTIGALVLSG